MRCEPFLLLDCAAQQGGVAFSSSGSKLAIGGHQMVSVFDYTTGGMVVKINQDGRVRCVALSKNGACLIVGGFDRKVRLHAIEIGTELRTFHADSRAATVRSVHLSTDSTLMAMGTEASGKGAAILYTASSATKRCLHTWNHDMPVWCVRLSPTVKMLAVGGYDMSLTIYSTSTYALMRRI